MKRKGAKIGKIVLLLLVMSVVILFWKHTQSDAQNLASIHELQHILTFVEQKGEDYAVDEWDYLVVYRYCKDDLHKKWGSPNESVEELKEDIWELAEGYRLVVNYDADGHVKKIEVQPLQN